MKLSDKKIRAVKPRKKDYKLFDGNGLFLLVSKSGGKWWRVKYRFGGKERKLSVGAYPDVSLKEARNRCLELRKQLEVGIDPSEARKNEIQAASGADSFETIARAWWKETAPKKRWKPTYCESILNRLDQHVFPWIGKRRIDEIDAPELLQVFRRVESQGALELAHRTKQYCGQIFRYAVAHRLAKYDPTPSLQGAMPSPKGKHYAAIKDPKKFAELLWEIEEYAGQIVTKGALRLLPLVFVRSSELRLAQWSEFDLDRALWRIPAERMKMKTEHLVPLSRQAVAILRELEPLTNRGGTPNYVFPAVASRLRPLSENTINQALRRMGYDKTQMTGHGFRTSASTLLHELGWEHHLIEMQLAHAERNSVSAAYNFAQYIPKRTEMMQAWADYLDMLRAGAEVIPIRRKKI